MDFSNVCLLGCKEVRELLSMPELIDIIETVLGAFSRKDGVVQPVRTVVPVVKPEERLEGYFGCMPMFSASHDTLSCKLVSFYPRNADKGLPSHMATVMLYDPATGALKAILDGEEITGLRTAAASAVASKLLISDEVKLRGVHIALIGSGVQARTHIEALKVIFNINKITVWSPTRENAEKCAHDVNGVVCSSAQEAVSGADIICTLTFSKTPVIMKDWIKPGAHINAVGACRFDYQELDGELMKQSVVYVDSKDAALVESGDVIMSKAEIYAEVGEIVNGKKVKRGDNTIFKSLGMAIEDGVAAKLVYDKYLNRKN